MASSNSITTSDASQIATDLQRTSRLTDGQPMRNALLICFYNDMNDTVDEYQNIMLQLQRAIEEIKTVTDVVACIRFLQTVKDKKVYMLVSESLGHQVMPRVHDISQVDSIFILSGNRRRHEEWVKKWPKIRGVFTDIRPICDALRREVPQREPYAAPRSLVTANQTVDRLDPSFMYTQLVKEIFLTIRFKQDHIRQFIDYCRRAFAGRTNELKQIDQLKQNYYYKAPIWWYTCDWFLSAMLNYGLRVMDVDLIIQMGFFISDLHRHIEQLHREQFSDGSSAQTFTVYRHESILNTDFQQIFNNKNGLMSFNNFLLTSKSLPLSLRSALNPAANPDSVEVLLVMTIDPSQATTPFASTREADYFGKEDGVLFATHSVFRIVDIKSTGRHSRLFKIHLSMTNDGDEELRALTERIREEILVDHEGWCRLGSVLIKLGQYKKAEGIYEMLRDQAMDKGGQAAIDNQLGLIKNSQGKYQEALAFHQKALITCQRTLPPTHLDLAASYNNVGKVYYSMGDYFKALSSYEKAEIIQQRSRSPIPSHFVSTYNNMGAAYAELGQTTRALSLHERALRIQENTLPRTHPDFASTYRNIGVVYQSMGDHSKACSYFERAVRIGQRSLPWNHPDLQNYQRSLSEVKKKA